MYQLSITFFKLFLDSFSINDNKFRGNNPQKLYQHFSINICIQTLFFLAKYDFVLIYCKIIITKIGVQIPYTAPFHSLIKNFDQVTGSKITNLGVIADKMILIQAITISYIVRGRNYP